MTTTVGFAARFSAETMEALRAQAKADGVSMNDLVNQAVEEKVSRRALIAAHLAQVKSDHAQTLKNLADR
jgi:hypothetical protein